MEKHLQKPDPMQAVYAAGKPIRRGKKSFLLAVGITAGSLLALSLGAGIWAYRQLSASLPQMAGSQVLPGLSDDVRIERDHWGVPRIRGKSRTDCARATGFLHAQERFFQMDLLRRRAAGELSALFGSRAVEMDKSARLFRFRSLAERIVRELPETERRVLEAYTGGVNDGLSALKSPPFEYLVLRIDPVFWRSEDSVLVLASMFFTLQSGNLSRESRIGLLRDTLPPALVAFLLSPAREWEAPLLGELSAPPVVPGPDVMDLRKMPPAPGPAASILTGRQEMASSAVNALPFPFPDILFPANHEEASLRGSNNWALSGAHTASGVPLVANDMHLGIAVPNTWYRASIEWRTAEKSHRVSGVTLPGTPILVAGSNGMVAWAFTNATGDFGDLVLLDADPADPQRYRTPDGSLPFIRHRERIEVKGGTEEILEVKETIWGPVYDTDQGGRARAACWVPARPGGMNIGLIGFESAATLEQLLERAHGAGIPAQNLTAGDRSGRIAWTIAGRIPKRTGLDGQQPLSWADGSRRWDGWLEEARYPRVVDPPSGRLWTANNRLVDGEMLRILGDGGYDLGARARQIRDGLMSLEKAAPADMLTIQLDDRVIFLERWRDLALRVLSPEACSSSPSRREFRRLAEQSWSGRASVESVGYRLIRVFRQEAAGLALEPLLKLAFQGDARRRTLALQGISSAEGPLWALVSEQPLHLLDSRFARWDNLLLAAVDQACSALTAEGRALAERTWGEANTLRMMHPLGNAIPWIGHRLHIPPLPLPGDSHMPRVQSAGSGASERFAVSPGHEEEGYFHMPGGQSGHPLSPHYADGHGSWARGEPNPFLPGPPENVLVLTPR